MSPAGERIFLSRAALGAIAVTFLLMGALAAGYGPMLEHLTRRFGIGLPVAGEVFSAHFAGALTGVVASMRLLERVSGRLAVAAALAVTGLGCAGAAAAPSWATFLGAVFAVGIGWGALDIGLNQLVAHSEGRRRSALLNALNGAFGVGAVAGPLLVSVAGGRHLSLLYAGGAALAVILIPAAARVSGRLTSPSAGEIASRPVGRAGLISLFVVGFVLYVGIETGTGGWMASHLESVGLGSVAAATLTSGFWLALALGRLLAALVPARVPAPAIVLAGSAVAAVALLAAVYGPAAPVAYIVSGLAIAPIFPTGVVWLARLSPGDARATSWLFPAAMVGGALVPGGISLVIARSGVGWAPAILAAVALGCLVAFGLAARRARRLLSAAARSRA